MIYFVLELWGLEDFFQQKSLEIFYHYLHLVYSFASQEIIILRQEYAFMRNCISY